MGIIKEASDEVSVVLDKGRALRAWASVSFARVALAMSLLGIVIFGGQYAYINYLITETERSEENLRREVGALRKELGYKVALDTITLCLESVKEDAELHAWYCGQAAMQYKKASTNWPQERVDEVAGRLAYAAMKSDVAHYLRSVELERLIKSPASREDDILQMLLGKAGIALQAFLAVAATVGAYLGLWILPNRRSARNA